MMMSSKSYFPPLDVAMTFRPRSRSARCAVVDDGERRPMPYRWLARGTTHPDVRYTITGLDVHSRMASMRTGAAKGVPGCETLDLTRVRSM